MTTGNKIATFLALAATATGVYLLLKNRNNMKQTNQQSDREDTERIPRGYRNNNPLNIRYVKANNWLGKTLPNTDGVFEQFYIMPYGYRAAFVLLQNYIAQGYKTVSDIIHRWAPTSENNTAGYINRVCSTTGFTPAAVIHPDNKDEMTKLVYAMALVENGYTPLPDVNEIEQGWNLI